MKWVILLVAKGGHVPGKLVHACLNVLVVLHMTAEAVNTMAGHPSMNVEILSLRAI